MTPDQIGLFRAASPATWARELQQFEADDLRLPDDLAVDAEGVARVRGDGVDRLIVDALAAAIERVRSDEDLTARTRRLLERDQEILDRLAK